MKLFGSDTNPGMILKNWNIFLQKINVLNNCEIFEISLKIFWNHLEAAVAAAAAAAAFPTKDEAARRHLFDRAHPLTTIDLNSFSSN